MRRQRWDIRSSGGGSHTKQKGLSSLCLSVFSDCGGGDVDGLVDAPSLDAGAQGDCQGRKKNSREVPTLRRKLGKIFASVE